MNKKIKFIVALSVFVLCAGCLPPAATGAQHGEKVVEAEHAVIDVQKDWRLGVQLWTFNRFTFYDAVDKAAALGLSYIEAYPGQRLSKERLSAKFHYTMPADIRKEVKQKLAQAGVKLLSYGVVKLPKDKAESRKLFDFAKDMGIETIVMEPPENAFDFIDSLCQEYKIKVAIHNHPKPTQYWNPDKVLAVCKGRSKWIGACADTGHWVRSGINPVEALKKLEGRIIELHLKDLNKFGERRAHDVVWGTGKADVKAILAELARQDFKGTFLIEYEYNWKNSMPDIARSIQYFDTVASELGRSRK